MSCPRCQAATPPDSRFCAQCGAPLPAQPQATRTTRRQMTVLFCDLVGSTELAQRVDPDDLLAALQAYHDMVRRIAARFGGFVARIIGDGVDVYFGYPLANEDDVARALHTALAIASEVQQIEVMPGEPLALRIGLATGIVAMSMDQGVVAGTTPVLAARIQAAVPVGGIGASPGTRRIAGDQFDFEDLGEQQLKGFDAPVAVSLVRGARSLDSRSAWRGRDASLPMIGRDAELAALLAQWQRAAAGSVHGAIVVSEPGLGKSRLVTALDQALPAQGHTVLRLQCSPFQVNSPLQPFVRHLAVAAGLAHGDSPLEQAEKLDAQLGIAGIDDPQECALLGALLGIPPGERHRLAPMPPPLQLHLTKEALQHYFTGLAATRPLLVIFEDMHWVDPTSMELVDLLLSGGAGAPVLLVTTARPGVAFPWAARDNVVGLTLQRLPDADAKAVAAQQSRSVELPAEWLATIVDRTDGVPLFIEEMTRMLIENRYAGRFGGGAAGAVPDTLMDLLTERLDSLPPGAKAITQLAAVIGREFDLPLLAAAAGEPDATLRASLQAMLERGLVLQGSADGERLQFKHALVEDTAYATIPPKRCAELHGRVAQALLAQFRDRVDHQPELAARHLTRAGDGLQAAAWWQAAGRVALSRGAPREAAGHLRAGLAALASVGAGLERDGAELGLLAMLGPTTMVLQGPGSAEFGEIQQRSYRLSQTLPDKPRLLATSYGWCLYNWGRARLATATRLADELLEIAAQRDGDAEAAMAANNMAGMVRFHLGHAAKAREHLARSTALYEPQRDAALYPVYLMDFGVFGRFYLALATQVAGLPDAAAGIAADALALAEGLGQPHTMGFAMLANFNTAVMRGDHKMALPMAERCIAFSSQFGFPEFIAMARVARGWALAHGQGRWLEGLLEIQAGAEGWAQTGFENWQPWFATLEAEILARLGRHTEALPRIEHHLARIAGNGERQFESPLLAEWAAVLAAMPGREDVADAAFDQAESLARAQDAGAWLERIARRREQARAGALAA